MTMRDNVEVAKESAEKSVTIEKLEKEIAKLGYNLSIADEIIGNLYRQIRMMRELDEK